MPMSNTSFLPQDYLERKLAVRTNVICLTLFGVVLTGVVAAWLVQGRQLDEVRDLQASTDARFEQAATLIEQVDQLRGKKAQMIAKAEVTATLVERTPRNLILSQIVNAMPPTVSFQDLKLETRVLPTATRPRTSMQRARLEQAAAEEPEDLAPAPTQTTVLLTGYAPTDIEVSEASTHLAMHPLFQSAEIKSTEEVRVEGLSMRSFQILITIDPDAEAAQIEPRLVARDPKQNPMGKELNIDPDNAAHPKGGRSAGSVMSQVQTDERR